MTYLEIEKIESLLKKTKSLYQNTDLHGKEYFDKAENLCQISDIYSKKFYEHTDWDICHSDLYSDDDVIYYDDKIKNNLEIMSEIFESILNSLPEYAILQKIRESIEKKNEIKEYSEKEKFLIETVSKYESEIDFGKVILDFVKNIKFDSIVFTEDEIKLEAIYNAVIERLELYKIELFNCKKTSEDTVNNSSLTINNNNSQSQNINMSLTLEDCFKSLDDCESVSDKEIEELKNQLNEIQELLKSKKGKKKTIKEKLGFIMKKICDKGTDAIISVLTILLQMYKELV